MIACWITLEMTMNAYQENKLAGLSKLLTSKKKGSRQIAKNDTIPKKIFVFLERKKTKIT